MTTIDEKYNLLKSKYDRLKLEQKNRHRIWQQSDDGKMRCQNNRKKSYYVRKKQYHEIYNPDKSLLPFKFIESCEVDCIEVNEKNIKFECPYCYTSYKLNGQPRKKAKHKIHTHGSNGDIKPRTETRIPHCIKKYCGEFKIKIS
jgi:hypothetical protein